MRAEVLTERVHVPVAALGGANGVDAEHQIGQAEFAVERRLQLDQFGVDGGRVGADRLGPDLEELSVAAGLGALVAEEGARVPELDRLRQEFSE